MTSPATDACLDPRVKTRWLRNIAPPVHPVRRDSVEPLQSLKFSVSSLKRQPGLNLES